REASEEAEEEIEDSEDEPETLGGVQQRKRGEAQLLDRRFDLRDILGRTDAHGHCHVGRLRGIAREEGLHVVRLSDMELLSSLKRKVYSRASEPANPRRRIGLGDADNAQ